MTNTNEECFFIFYLTKSKSEGNDNKGFSNSKENNTPKCILTKQDNGKIIKIIKFDIKLIKDNKIFFDFDYARAKYKLTLENLKGKTFIFDLIIQKGNTKILQKE